MIMTDIAGHRGNHMGKDYKKAAAHFAALGLLEAAGKNTKIYWCIFILL